MVFLKKIKLDALINSIAIILCSFHLYTGLFGLLISFEQRSFHLFLSLCLVFLTHSFSKKELSKAEEGTKGIQLVDIIIILLLFISCSFIFFNWTKFMPFMVRKINNFEIFLTIITILIVLESARRVAGLAFPILVFLGFLYALYGHYIVGYWGHPKISMSYMLSLIYLSPDAIWGFMTGLSATYIALFVIFGSLLLSCGGGQTLVDLSKIIAGKLIGGPAKVAVIASAAFSMISGSPMANVATTGSFTIPMMKRLGYPSEFAGGVESAASTAGILTPPIMGAAAFIMAEFLQIPYLKVCISAAIPAFLFYLSVFMGVHFQSLKLNLKSIPEKDIPNIREVFTLPKMAGVFLPIIVLLFLLFRGYSLSLVGTCASLSILIVYLFSDFHYKNIYRRLFEIPRIFAEAGKAVIIMAPVLTSANILLFLLDHTGINLKFSNFVMSMSGGNLFVILLLTGVLVMILGCGLPATAAYVLGVTVAVPSLVKLGINPISIHLFILYYSIIAGITPPVCPTVYVGAAIAQSNWLKTAWVTMKLAPLLYIMPFVFVFDPTYIMIGSTGVIIYNVIMATVGVIIMESGLMGHLINKCNIFERITLFIAGILLLIPGGSIDLIGIIISSLIIIGQIFKKKNRENIRVS